MYEVNLNARPEQFLDWDKPLKDQPIAEHDSEAWSRADLRKTFDYNVEKGAVSGANVYHNYVPNQSFVVRSRIRAVSADRRKDAGRALQMRAGSLIWCGS